MNPRLRHGLAAAIAAGIVAVGCPVALLATTSAYASPGAPGGAETTSGPADPTSSPTTSTDPTTEPTGQPPVTATPPATQEPQTGAFEVADAQLRWAINNEVNNRAHAPGTINFLLAGLVPNPGKGGQTIVGGVWRGTSTQAWRATSGKVRIEKQQPNGTFQAATWSGLSTQVGGAPLSGTNGPFSGHQVVIDGGTGVVDTVAGTATIRWKGSFSVVLYSGMTFFTVTDPVLSVARTGATLRATLAGYASSQTDQSIWAPVAPQQVVLAALPKVDLQADAGFTAQPQYLGIRYDAPAGDPAQVRNGSWGSFPASFLAYQRKAGAAAYWYSSGGASDPHKVPAPLAISYAAGAPIQAPTQEPEEEPSGQPEPSATPSPTTSVHPTPPTPTAPTPTAPTQPAGPPLPTQPATRPADQPPPVALTDPGGPEAIAALAAGDTSPVYAHASADTASPPTTDSGLHWTWFAGSALLLGAAALTLLTTRISSSAKGTP
ncbi:hypothetical protein [Nocardioides sp. GXZ039]|uniref:hypothetical protein n=1 Tax=Nocardioides sp. GXZ039 TaxID=3136018 RepID=UPI0030F416BA